MVAAPTLHPDPSALRRAEDLARWGAYLAGLDRHVGTDFAGRVRALWSAITDHYGPLFPAPAAGELDDGVFHLAWSRGPHYAEVDLRPGESLSWFVKHRDTGAVAGDEDVSWDEAREPLLARLAPLAP